MGDIAIKVSNISKSFSFDKPKGLSKIFRSKNTTSNVLNALEKISFTVERGEVIGVIGLNGSGKTTLLRLIARVYKPDHGSIEVKGRLSPLMHLGTGFQEDLNARENIIMNGLLLGVSKQFITERVDKIIEYAELEKFQNLKLRHFSSGMRARLGFAVAMNVEPQILLVDEILSVGDQHFRKKSFEAFLDLKKEKKTILYATHNLESLKEFCDKVLLLNKGKIVTLGTPEDAIAQYKLIKTEQ